MHQPARYGGRVPIGRGAPEFGWRRQHRVCQVKESGWDRERRPDLSLLLSIIPAAFPTTGPRITCPTATGQWWPSRKKWPEAWCGGNNRGRTMAVTGRFALCPSRPRSNRSMFLTVRPPNDNGSSTIITKTRPVSFVPPSPECWPSFSLITENASSATSTISSPTPYSPNCPTRKRKKKKKIFNSILCKYISRVFFLFTMNTLSPCCSHKKTNRNTTYNKITKNNKQYRDKSGMFPMDHSSLREHRRRTSRGTKVPRVDCTSFRS